MTGLTLRVHVLTASNKGRIQVYIGVRVVSNLCRLPHESYSIFATIMRSSPQNLYKIKHLPNFVIV